MQIDLHYQIDANLKRIWTVLQIDANLSSKNRNEKSFFLIRDKQNRGMG